MNQKEAWLRRMHGECMALKNAWFGNKNEPEGCMALKNAWRMQGFKDGMV